MDNVSVKSPRTAVLGLTLSQSVVANLARPTGEVK
jgi:hypothetical protein